ncbi:uncharacterized protein LOC117287980 [Asterias rubens]|uniref:uncharacterized protein LOC117287980 n=1 Tax=Asterias rubens TaxID=7604 RepID=UPI001455A321|nr:uncharacterized protein LOC117287980 [Asterias rubens]
MEHGQLPPNGTLEGHHQDLNHPYWMHPSHRANHSSGNRKVPVDCHGDGEAVVDDLLDRSGLFDELVCQILDESPPNTEAGKMSIQQNQHFDSAIKDQFQGLHIRTPADTVSSAWAKTKTERSHESSVHPRFPPGITERPEHPALFSEMYPGIPANEGQQGNITPATGSPLQQPMAGDAEKHKRMQDYFHSAPNFMKGENSEPHEFKANFPERSFQGVLPNSGGDCRNIVFPNSENQYGASRLNLTSQSMSSGRGGQDGARDTQATEDPHQYFRQRASAAQQAQQFPRPQGRSAQQFPMNEQQQAMNLPFANQDAKTHLMQQMNMANNWTNFNNLLTKGNLNLRTNTMAFDQNQIQRNMNASNPFGQNQVPNYQFPMQRMSSPHQASGRYPSHSQKTPSSGGHFQNPIFPVRPQIHNQSGSPNMAFWQQSQQCQQNDNQNYLGQLHVQLEECYYQFYSIEKERKKTEVELARMNPGRRISSANTIQTPQLPDNPTSLDRLIVDFYKEHSRVSTLMSKIGGLCGDAVHPRIDAYLENWVEAIQEVRRREELLRRGLGRRQQDDSEEAAENKGNVLVDVIQKLALATRSSRTALWCALQMSKDNLTLQSSD